MSLTIPNGIDTTYGSGVYNDSPTTWTAGLPWRA
jgi:hypothetical protein